MGLPFLHCGPRGKSAKLDVQVRDKRAAEAFLVVARPTLRTLRPRGAREVGLIGLAHGRLRWALLLSALLACLCSAPTTVAADARSDYLIRLLTDSNQFRVRAQAAISLGSITGSSSVVGALVEALGDEHPAVRAAAANSLGRLGDPSAIAALRSSTKDDEPPVRVAAKAAIARLESVARRRGVEVPDGAPGGPPKYYIATGTPGSKVTSLSRADLQALGSDLRDRLQRIDGVMLAPSGESPAAARKVLEREKLKGFYIESSVTSVDEKPDGAVRVAVSLIVATYPGRDMRAMMSGAATAMGGRDARQQAMAGALQSALRKLPQAMVRD
jgi:hypothetical protein